MTQITINIENPEEETFIETFLKKMKISFSKSDKDDFEFTDEMKRVIDERLNADRSDAQNAWDVVREIRAKYGV